MNLDENAAAFGLFHLMFANLTQQLAAALFYIRRLKEPDLKFEDVFKLKFSRLLKEFEKELKQLDGGSHDMELQALRPVCERIKDLGDWRNARAHPRVQIDEHGITIYDWRTRKQLIMDRDETLLKIERTHWLTIALEQNAGILLRHLKSDREWDEVFDKMWGNGENEEILPSA
jgi:hypothetical protein